MNEFDGVHSKELKKQIRGITAEMEYIEKEELWAEDMDTGREYIRVDADYWLGDLAERKRKLKRELARRWIKPPEKIDLIYEATYAFVVEMDRRFGPQYRAGEHVRDCFGQAIFDIGELVRAIEEERWPVTWPHEELEVAYAA